MAICVSYEERLSMCIEPCSCTVVETEDYIFKFQYYKWNNLWQPLLEVLDIAETGDRKYYRLSSIESAGILWLLHCGQTQGEDLLLQAEIIQTVEEVLELLEADNIHLDVD